MFPTIYSDFANYAASYFGLTSPTKNGVPIPQTGLPGTFASAAVGNPTNTTGFSTLFSGEYGFNPNGGSFDKPQFLDIIHGNESARNQTTNAGIGTLQGSVKLWNVAGLLRYAVDSNCFSNRSPVNGGTAVDPSFNNNYGVTDGFLAGDMVFIPNNGFGITLNLNINYQTTLNTYLANNIGPQNALPDATRFVDASLNDASGGTIVSGTGAVVGKQTDVSLFHSTTATNTNLLSRTTSCPLLIRMI